MRFSYIALVVALSFSPVFPVSSDAAPLGRVVATVNGDMISALELDKMMASELKARKLDPANPKQAEAVATLRSQALELMITERILMQEAARLGISVSDEDVNAEVKRVMDGNKLGEDQFAKVLAQQGQTLDSFRRNLKSRMITQQIISRNIIKKVVISDEEVSQFYREHSGQIPTGNAHVALIVYPDQKSAEKYASKLNADDFASVARSVSVGPNAGEGGDMGNLSVEDLAPVIRDQVEKLQSGQVSSVFDLGGSPAQVCLLSYESVGDNGGSAAEMDAATHQRIVDTLKGSKIEARWQEYQQQLRSRALVEIRN